MRLIKSTTPAASHRVCVRPKAGGADSQLGLVKAQVVERAIPAAPR